MRKSLLFCLTVLLCGSPAARAQYFPVREQDGVFVRGGKLFLNFMKPSTAFRYLPTKLAVKTGEWNTLKIVSDIKQLTVTLNGKTQTFDNIGRGGMFRASCFGGPVGNYGTPAGVKMFRGDLRSLRIFHNAEK